MNFLKNFYMEIKNSPAIIMVMSTAIIVNEILNFSGLFSIIWISIFVVVWSIYNNEYRRKYK